MTIMERISALATHVVNKKASQHIGITEEFIRKDAKEGKTWTWDEVVAELIQK
jgi:hypothetical protein